MIIKLLVEGGDMKPGPALSQKLGPLGINMGKVISEINKATSHLKGMKIPVELNIDPKTKDFKVKIFMPPVSELLKKELKIEKGTGRGDIKVGNIAMEQIIAIAKSKREEMLASDLKSAVKTVVGTCVSVGILIENKPAKEVEEEIDQGKYDELINSEKTQVSEEKKKQLEEYFDQVKAEQEKIMKKIEEERAKKEEKAAEEKTEEEKEEKEKK